MKKMSVPIESLIMRHVETGAWSGNRTPGGSMVTTQQFPGVYSNRPFRGTQQALSLHLAFLPPHVVSKWVSSGLDAGCDCVQICAHVARRISYVHHNQHDGSDMNRSLQLAVH